MTKILSWSFVFLWGAMAVIEAHNGDIFHTVTSATIALWNLSFLRDLKRLDDGTKKT